MAQELNIKAFIDLVPHRVSVRIKKKVVWGDFLKVMVEAEHATAVAQVVQKGLHDKTFNKRLDNIRLMPMHPMRNMMSPETFCDMILTHNKTMYNLVEVQVNNVWEMDREIELNTAVNNWEWETLRKMAHLHQMIKSTLSRTV